MSQLSLQLCNSLRLNFRLEALVLIRLYIIVLKNGKEKLKVCKLTYDKPIKP